MLRVFLLLSCAGAGTRASDPAQAEALLRDHVRDVEGKTHDIVVLGHNVAQVRAQMEAYGVSDAVGGN